MALAQQVPSARYRTPLRRALGQGSSQFDFSRAAESIDQVQKCRFDVTTDQTGSARPPRPCCRVRSSARVRRVARTAIDAGEILPGQNPNDKAPCGRGRRPQGAKSLGLEAGS